MKIIEFCGAPGVGKSTMSDMLKDQLEKQGFKVKRLARNEKSFSVFPKIGNFFRKTCRKINFTVCMQTQKAFREYVQYTMKYPEARKYSKRFLMCLSSLQITKFSHYDFLLCDEAFIQNATSTVHDRKFTDEELDWFSRFLNQYIYDKYEMDIVYCYLDLLSDLNRIEVREKNGDRFNVGTQEEKIERLRIKIHNIERILKCVHCNKIIRYDTSDINCCIEKFLSEYCASET